MNIVVFLVILYDTLASCQKVYGDIVSNHSISLKSEYSNMIDTISVKSSYNITGLVQASNNSVSSTMIKKIFLWTVSFDSGQQYELLDLENSTSITASHFLTNKPTFILVHGFLGNGLESWIISIKDELLDQQTCNVVSVEWPSGHEYFVIDYYHVVGHVPVVGAEIARLLDMLTVLREQKNSAVHIIGHSLGAHIAGFVGKNVEDPIARISGLDPAGLTFHNSDSSKRLDRGDATYVDVIHTNGCRSYLSWTDCFGIDTALGHTDYWPNGGRHQPACLGKRRWQSKRQRAEVLGTSLQSKVSWSVGCDHMMSHTYFLESLRYGRSSDMFRARPCDSYSHYEQGNCSCGEVQQYMGIHSKAGGVGDYYLHTSSTPPYALPDPACPGFLWRVLEEWRPTACYVCPIVVVLLVIILGKSMCYYASRLRLASRRQPVSMRPLLFIPPDQKCTCGRTDYTAHEDTAAP